MAATSTVELGVSRRHYINNAAVVALTAGVGTGDGTLTVTSASSFPASFPWTGVINAGLADAEVVLVTAAVGTTLTVTRGFDSTAAQSHGTGATFAHVAVSADYDEANSHIAATSGVHGVSGSVVGTGGTQTLTGKTLTAPTLTAPTITGGVTVTGNVPVTGNVTATGSISAATVSGVGTCPVGSVTMYGGSAAPTGWLLCDGSPVSRTTYAALYAVVGNAFGSGDGVTTFNLPNTASVFPHGGTPGVTGGEPSHSHTLSDAGQALINLGPVGSASLTERRVGSNSWTATEAVTLSNAAVSATTAGGTGAALLGSTDAVATIPPYLNFNFIIKT